MNKENKKILNIALPSVVSNITVPLLGLVDVAIVGHLGDASYIGAIAVGGMMFNVIYWIFGFLRMGTSGMTSQALGAHRLDEVVRLLVRSLAVGLALAVALVALQWPLCELTLWAMQPTDTVGQLARVYFYICIWGAPAMLGMFALTGWFIGMQNTRAPMVIAIVQNVVNIVASVLLVMVAGMKVEGVACGTLIAQYAALLLAMVLCVWRYGRLKSYFAWHGVWQRAAMVRFFGVNRDIFFRTLCLVSVMLFFTSAGARQGDTVLAVNTLLMQFYMLFSYVMDGFAFAGEALGGRYYGAGNGKALQATIVRLFWWGVAMAVGFTVVYAIGGNAFLMLLTSDGGVVAASAGYYLWALALPLAGMAAFVWDGIYIGCTQTRGMLVSMFFAALAFFLVYFSLRHALHNHALWMAFIAFLAVRGLVQTFIWRRYMVVAVSGEAGRKG